MNSDHSAGVERGGKPFYDALMAAERKCCVCSSDSINLNRICMHIFVLGAACRTIRNMHPCSLLNPISTLICLHAN